MRENDSTSYLTNSKDFQKIDNLLLQYFKSEYGRKGVVKSKVKSFSKQITQELRTFQHELPLKTLEMQIILSFMDKKRDAIKDLLWILKSDEKAKLLKQKKLPGMISSDVYKELN